MEFTKECEARKQLLTEFRDKYFVARCAIGRFSEEKLYIENNLGEYEYLFVYMEQQKKCVFLHYVGECWNVVGYDYDLVKETIAKILNGKKCGEITQVDLTLGEKVYREKNKV